MTDTFDYFLFPHTTLSSNALENLCAFLPGLNILEITSRASIPERAKDRICVHPVISNPELISRIRATIVNYSDFAKVHGGPGGILGFLSHGFGETDEPRYRIQEALRGKVPTEKDAEENQIVQAALFLEMARELDEKELEIEAGFDRMNEIEQEFRNILGIEEEEALQVGADLSSPLVPDESSLLYMLKRRIENWFHMLSSGPAIKKPVFVTVFPEVVLEALDIVRTGCEKSGQDFSPIAYTLGPVPWAGRLLDAHEILESVSACGVGLGDFIKSAAGSEDAEKTENKRRLLQSAFEELCKKCGAAQDEKATLKVTVVRNVSAAAIPGLPQPGFDGEGSWPPVFLAAVP